MLKMKQTPHHEHKFSSPKYIATPDFHHLRERELLTENVSRLVLVLVGLPARGKSFVAKKLEGLLRWKGLQVKIFNVGSYRRTQIGAKESANADFYSAENEEAKQLRQKLAQDAMQDMLTWICGQTEEAVAIFDATNSTNQRRLQTLKACQSAEKPMTVVFIECICEDEQVLLANMNQKILNSPDFQGLSHDEALESLKKRIENYQKIYETIDDDRLSYIKLFNFSSKILTNKIYGSVSKSIVPALMAWHIGTRPIWLARCGTPVGAVGGSEIFPFIAPKDAPLSEEGLMFAQLLGEFVNSRCKTWYSNRVDPSHNNDEDLVRLNDGRVGAGFKVLTSTVPRAYQTAVAAQFGAKVEQTPNLNPLDVGVMNGFGSSDKVSDLEWYQVWKEKPLFTRFPGGESYADVVSRLEPCITDVEQQMAPVLVISHVSVLQVLVAYFLRTPMDQVHNIQIPMNSVLELTPAIDGKWGLHIHRLLEETHIPGYCATSQKDQTN